MVTIEALIYSFPKFEPVHFSLAKSFASCLAYRFLRRHVILSGIPISLRIFHNFLWSTQSLLQSQWSRSRCFVLLEFPYILYDPAYVGNLISGSSAFSKSSLCILKFSVHILLKISMNDNMWNQCNCTVIWTFFGIDFLWDWK